jgi:hypothetical protein
VGSRADLGGNVEAKNSSHRNSNTRTVRSVESCFTDFAVLHRATLPLLSFSFARDGVWGQQMCY